VSTQTVWNRKPRRKLPARGGGREGKSEGDLLLKFQLATVVGTIDVLLYFKYGTTLANSNFAEAYASSPIYNIPPLAAGFSALLAAWSNGDHQFFAFFLKLPGILAETAFAVVLWRRFGHEEGLRRWAGLLVALSPITIPITGLHGNLDSLLAVFIGMSLLMAMDDRPIACAIWFGLAANLKVSPLLLSPAFFFWWLHRGRVWPFMLAVSVVILGGWSPGLIECPRLFLERVIGYSSLWGTWGISRILYLTGSPNFSSVLYGAPSVPAALISAFLKVIVIVASFVLAWRRRKLPAMDFIGTIAATWTIFFVFAPGGAPQYTVWPLVPLLLYDVRLGIAYTVAAIPFMFIFYPFAFTSVLPFKPYAALAQVWPDVRSEYAWTWPALLLWATMLVFLIWEWRRWWNGNPAQGGPALFDPRREEFS
jgi:hypothetical protein